MKIKIEIMRKAQDIMFWLEDISLEDIFVECECVYNFKKQRYTFYYIFSDVSIKSDNITIGTSVDLTIDDLNNKKDALKKIVNDMISRQNLNIFNRYSIKELLN